MIQKPDYETRDAWECLRKYRRYLTRQQLRTLAGQVKVGEVHAAMNGLDKILTRAGH